LSKQRLLEKGRFSEPHKVALVFVRTLLESGASQHVEFTLSLSFCVMNCVMLFITR
jgi:hypothetical protein